MYIQNRTESLFFRVCPEFKKLLSEIKKQYSGYSDSDIMHIALSNLVRNNSFRWDDNLKDLCDKVEDLDTNKDRKRKKKLSLSRKNTLTPVL